jgi:hypothetical protein
VRRENFHSAKSEQAASDSEFERPCTILLQEVSAGIALGGAF